MLEKILKILKENNEYITKGTIKDDFEAIVISKQLSNKKEEMKILKNNIGILKYIVHLTYFSPYELNKTALNNLEITLNSLDSKIASKEEGLYMLFLNSLDINSNQNFYIQHYDLSWLKDREKFEYCLELSKNNCDKMPAPKIVNNFYYR